MRLLGVDWGKKRIGLALSAGGLVKPLEVIDNTRSLTPVFQRIIELSARENIGKIVVGLPLDALGNPTPQSLEVKSFVKRLKAQVKPEVVFQDEFLTSKESFEDALKLDFSRKKRRNLDALSAARVLKRFLEEREEED